LLLVPTSQVSTATTTAVHTGMCILAVATAMIAGTSTLMDPFDGGDLTSNRATVAHLGLRVPGSAANEYTALDTALRPYVTRGRTPMFSEGPTAGLIYQLGGVPVGSTWNDPGSVNRTAGILELACNAGAVRPELEPILVLGTHPSPTVLGALRKCGYDFPDG